MVNTQAEQVFGYSRAELVAQPVEMLVPERFRSHHPELRKTFLADPRPRPMGAGRDLFGLKKDGFEFPVEIGLNPIETDEGTMVLLVIDALKDDSGKLIGFAKITRDVTERVQAAREVRAEALRRTQAELAHVARVTTLGELTASIAHEVNQPIAATVLNAETGLRWLDAEPPDLDEARQAFGDIVRDGNRAAAVVQRIRNLSKKAPARDERVDISAVIREVIELTRSEAMKNSVLLQTELVEGLPLVQGDRVELQQVILNLILNAVEAMSEMGEGSRELLIGSGTTESGDVLVAVRDSGPGLAPDAFERLFKAFYTTKPNGLGLGLSICRSIIEAHGGHLWASGNAPRGAVFQFTLPGHSDIASPQ
jgi:PAS domain S-box-containing protein